MYRKFLHMLLVMAITMSMLLLVGAPASALELGSDDGGFFSLTSDDDDDDDDDGNNCLLGILCLFGGDD